MLGIDGIPADSAAWPTVYHCRGSHPGAGPVVGGIPRSGSAGLLQGSASAEDPLGLVDELHLLDRPEELVEERLVGLD